MKRAAWVLWTSSTSSVAAPPRSRITVAAWRGTTSTPDSLSVSPLRFISSGVGRCPVSPRVIVRAYLRGSLPGVSDTRSVEKWICEACGFIYEQAEGDPDGGIPAGTAFEDIPDTWFCPVCGARKKDFVPYED
ncbi:MAG: rubredoxin [Solirubrobacterales bacterium]|nr:rubredoxin [Solirubrobacterales bacterium]